MLVFFRYCANVILESLGVFDHPECPKCNIPFVLRVNYKDQFFGVVGITQNVNATRNFLK